MHMFKKLCAQATVCSVLLSHAMGADRSSPSQPQTPPHQRPISRDLSPESSPLRKMTPQFYRDWLAANREWFFDGRRVIFCDLEADPTIGGPITEATFIETQHGEATGEVKHYYFNPEKKVTHPKVKKVAPIDPTQQPTFSQCSSDIYEFIKDATLVTYGAFDTRKLLEHFSYQPPFGTLYKITYVDALSMVKHDYARQQGMKVATTPHKVVSTVSKSRSEVAKEQAAKRKTNRDEKEIRDLNKYLKKQDAKNQGLPSPQPKSRKSIYDGVSFSQSKVAKRNGISDKFGAASIGLDSEKSYVENNIPKEHRGEDHHAFADTLTLAGLGTLLTQPDANILANQSDFADTIRVLNFDDAGVGDSDESQAYSSQNDDDDFGSEPPLPQSKRSHFSSPQQSDPEVTPDGSQEMVSKKKRLRSSKESDIGEQSTGKENKSKNPTSETDDLNKFVSAAPPMSPLLSSQTKRAKPAVGKAKKEKKEKDELE